MLLEKDFSKKCIFLQKIFDIWEDLANMHPTELDVPQ